MSSAEAGVDNTVDMTTTVGSVEATRTLSMFALLAAAQLTWIGALVYTAIRLLS
jgi:hypothetical protein